MFLKAILSLSEVQLHMSFGSLPQLPYARIGDVSQILDLSGKWGPTFEKSLDNV